MVGHAPLILTGRQLGGSGVNSASKDKLLVQESITLASGASLESSALTKVGAVTLDTNIIMVPTP